MQFLAWPAVVLILGIICIFTFKKPFERLIDRIQKVSKGGFETSHAIQPAYEQQTASKVDELLKRFNNTLLSKREEEIRLWLEKSQVPAGRDRERILIRHLADQSLVAKFEKVYSMIWGSQIGTLQFLNSAGPGGVEPESLRPWFEQAAIREPELYEGDTLERWLSFLESYSLVVKIGNNVGITIEGREFLKYIVDQGYILYRRG